MLNLEEKKQDTFWKSKNLISSSSFSYFSISSYILAQSSFWASSKSSRLLKSLKDTFFSEKLIILVVPINSFEKLKYFYRLTEVMLPQLSRLILSYFCLGCLGLCRGLCLCRGFDSGFDSGFDFGDLGWHWAAWPTKF